MTSNTGNSNSENSTYFDLLSSLRLIRRHLFAILGITGVTVAIVMSVTVFLIPKKYKSFSTITIPSRYFIQPAVEDILPGVTDPAEMQAQRELLIEKSIGRDFLEKIRADYKLFPARGKDVLAYEKNMQKLQAQFEIFSTGLSTFQIGFIDSSPNRTNEIAKKELAAIVDNLVGERSRRLTELRDDLLGKVDSMSFNLNQAVDPMSSSRPEVLRGELLQLNGIIASLRTQYTPNHPLVKRYEQRANVIHKWLTEHGLPEGGKVSISKQAQGLSSSTIADTERYTDLLKRIDRLNIVLDYDSKNLENVVQISAQPFLPTTPVWPNNRISLFWSLLAGLLISGGYISMQSFASRQRSPAAELATGLEINYLGRIPFVAPSAAPVRGDLTPEQTAAKESANLGSKESTSI